MTAPVTRLGFLLALCFGCSASAQRWSGVFDLGPTSEEYARAVVATADGGFTLAADVHDGSNHNLWVLHLDGMGSPRWQRLYPASGGFTSMGKLRQTADGGYVVAAGIGNSPTVLKLDAAGGVEWQRSYQLGSFTGFWSVRQTADGGYVAAGNVTGIPPGLQEPLLVRLDATGNEVWQRVFITSESFPVAQAVAVASDGGYAVAGSLDRDGYWVAKVDATGAVEWQKRYSLPMTLAEAIEATADGGFILNGRTASGAGFGYSLLKLRMDGSVDWARAYGFGFGAEGYDVHQTPDGGYLAAGYWGTVASGGSQDYLVLKVDALGAIEWQRSYGRRIAEHAYALDVVPTGGLIVAGLASLSGPSYDAWVLRLDPHGDVAPACPLLLAATAQAQDVAVAVTDLTGGEPAANTSSTFPVAPIDSAVVPIVECADSPLLTVRFAAYDAVRCPVGVRVSWTTLEESDTVGFRVLRRTSGSGGPLDVGFTPARGSAQPYVFLDAEAPQEAEYSIEECTSDGRGDRTAFFPSRDPVAGADETRTRAARVRAHQRRDDLRRSSSR